MGLISFLRPVPDIFLLSWRRHAVSDRSPDRGRSNAPLSEPLVSCPDRFPCTPIYREPLGNRSREGVWGG